MKKIIQLFCFLPFLSVSQWSSIPHFGANIGLLLNVGTHVNRIGFTINAFYSDYFYQLNLGNSSTFNLTSYGKRKNFFESRSSIGMLLLAGRKNNEIDIQFDGLLHNTSFEYGLGFNYLWYLDNVNTSQLSGGWGLHIKNISMLFENDVFGGQARDRFRTGQLTFRYRREAFAATFGLYLWTGETRNTNWVKESTDRCPNGYRSLEDTEYGRTSHGILFGGFSYHLGYGQFAFVKTGIDSEHIRHAFQNRLIHDLIFLPKKMKRNTPHYPRLDADGCPVFDPSKVRKDRWYFQIGSNENWSN